MEPVSQNKLHNYTAICTPQLPPHRFCYGRGGSFEPLSEVPDVGDKAKQQISPHSPVPGGVICELFTAFLKFWFINQFSYPLAA